MLDFYGKLISKYIPPHEVLLVIRGVNKLHCCKKNVTIEAKIHSLQQQGISVGLAKATFFFLCIEIIL